MGGTYYRHRDDAYRISDGIPERKRSLGRYRNKCEKIFQTDTPIKNSVGSGLN
jgi:hypothetical protein